MKTFSAEAAAALDKGEAIVSGAVVLSTSPDPLRIWGGHGSLVIDGQAFVGVGARGLVSASGGALGGQEQGAELTLSGVDPDVVPSLGLASLRGVPVVLYRLIFNGSGSTLLQASVYLRGRVDRASVEETPGGASTIKVGIEGAARGLGRRSERMRSDADQRLIRSTDTSMKRIAYAGEKVIHWGGKPPARGGTAVGGSGRGVVGTQGGVFTDRTEV